MTDPNTSENWFVAQLKPNGLNLARRNLRRQGFRDFVPQQMESILRAGKRVSAPRPLFPGYILVQFDVAQPGWQAINSTRGIARLILNDIRRPTPLPSQFMAGLMARCDKDGLLKAPDELQVGDDIRVISGPFADLVTTVEQLDQHDRLQVLVDLMGQNVRTTLPRSAVNRI